MSFKFYCDCGQKVSATDDMIGTQAACPRCGALLTVSPPVYAAPAASPEPVPPPPPAQAPPPIRRGEPIPPRPTALLAILALIAMAGMVGGAVWLFRDRLAEFWPLFVGGVIGMPVGAAIAAIFLRGAVKIVTRFDMPSGEAIWFCLLTSSLSFASNIPMLALAKQPEFAQQVGIASTGVSLLLTVACYAFLIRDDFSRPIGWGKGILSYLMNLVLIVAFFGLLGGLGYLLWRMA